MPRLLDFLHYRIVDVSSIQILVKNWMPMEFKMKRNTVCGHRAMDDIE